MPAVDVDALTAGAQELVLAELLRARLLKTVVVANPAAGAELSIPVPAGEVWLVRALTAILTADATVVNRVTVLNISDGSSVWHRGSAFGAQTASQVIPYSWVREWGAQQVTLSSSGVAAPFPAVALAGGSVIASATQNRQAGDQFSGIVAEVVALTPHEILKQGQWIRDHLR